MLKAHILNNVKPKRISKYEIVAEKILNQIINKYGQSLKQVLRYQKLAINKAITTLIINGILFYFIPKGFFPVQDTGIIQGISVAKATLSFEKWL